MASLDTLQDNFPGPTLDPQWTYAGTNVTYTVDGALNLNTAALQAIGSNGGVTSTADYSLHDAPGVLVRVYAAGANANQTVSFEISSTITGEKYLIQKSAATITYSVWNGAAYAINTGGTYNSTAHAWWRIRHVSSVIYFDTSPDGLTWTVQTSGSHAPKTAAYKLKLRTDWVTATTATTVSFDSVNTPPPVPLLETLQDNFDTPPLNPAKWSVTTTGTAVTATVSGGTLNLNVGGGTTGAHTATVSSVDGFTFADSYLHAKVTPSNGTASTPLNGLKVLGVGNLEQIQMYKTGSSTTITCRIYNNVNTQVFTSTFAYDAPTQAWWRIRHTGGTVFWETATTDAGPWTAQRQTVYALTAATHRAAFNLDYNGVPQTFSAKFDYVNIAPSVATPTSAGDIETLSPPTLAQTTTLTAGSATDVETLDPPTAARTDAPSTPDSITDPETLAPPTAAFIYQATVNPDNLTDGETLPAPTAALPAALTVNPDRIIDDETLPNPTVAIPVAATVLAETILEVESSGPPTVTQVGPPPPPLSSLQDRFGGTVLNPQWFAEYTGVSPGAGGVAVSAGTVNMTTWSGSDAATRCRITTVGTYRFTDSHALARVFPDTPVLTHLVYMKIRPPLGAEYFQMQWGNGTLNVEAKDPAGADIFTPVSVAFNNITMAWWRIRHTSGSLYFETTADNITWTVHKTVPYVPADPGYLLEMGTNWSGIPPNSRSASFDNVNVPPQPLDTLRDDFSTALDPVKWTTTTQGTAVAVNTVGGTLNFDVSVKPTATHSGTVTSTDAYTFTNSYLLAQVTPTTGDNRPITGMRVKGDGTAEEFSITRVPTASLTFRGINASGVTITTVTVGYTPSTMAWWRIRHSGTTLYFETAQFDVGPWTVQRSAVYTPSAYAYKAVFDHTWTVATIATVTRVDNVNNIPAYSVIDGEVLPGPTLLPTALPMETLIDDCTTLTQWYTHGTLLTPNASGGTINLPAPAGVAANTIGGVSSLKTYDLIDSYLLAKINTTSSTGIQSVFLTVINPSNPKEFFQIFKLGTAIWYRGWDPNGNVFISSTGTYSATTHAWWRIRHTAGTMYWETSPDSASWTIRDQYAYTPSSRALQVRLETSFSGVSTATTVRYDNINIDTAARPDPIVDPEQVGAPALTQAVVIPPATPDGIVDPEEFGDPEAIFAAGDSHTPDSIEDPEEIIGPDSVIAVDDTYPDSLADPEAFGPPTADYLGTVDPDPIVDPETLGPPTPIRDNNEAFPEALIDPETLGDVLAMDDPYPTYYPDSIIDPDLATPPDSLILRVLNNWDYGAGIYSDGPYSGALPTPTPPAGVDNLIYGYGTYGYGIYYGIAPVPPPAPKPLLSDVAPPAAPMHILGIGPWSPDIDWRGLPNYGIGRGRHAARPALALPPATSKGFTLRLAEGSEARIDLSMRRGEAIVIDEMDTDLWWRRKDPRTKQLEVIGRFNCAHIELATSDTGVSLSAQFEDYVTVLGARMVLEYRNPEALPDPTSMWDIHTPVTDILKFALPPNTGLDLSEVTGPHPYPLGNIIQPYHLPPGTLIADVMNNLEAISPTSWEWWIETPADVNKAPKLRFVIGERGSDKGVTLLDAGAGPTPIAAWARNGASDDYANSLYYTGSGTGEGADAGGGVVEDIPAQILQYGQRDAQFGSTSQGGVIAQIRAGAVKKLRKLANRTPTYTITLAHSFWRGRSHIDVGDTVTLILRLGKEVIATKYRVSEIAVTIDENGMEDVTLTLGTPRASSDPRSSQSPIMRMLRALKNYEAPNGALDIPPPEE